MKKLLLSLLLLFCMAGTVCSQVPVRIQGYFDSKDQDYEFTGDQVKVYGRDHSQPLVYRVKYLTYDTFIWIENLAPGKNCNPVVLAFQILSYDNSTLILRKISTGWKEEPDQQIVCIHSS